MVIDTLKNGAFYSNINPLFAKVFAYLDEVDLASMAEGKYEIDGERVFVMIVDNKPLKSKADAALEVHDKYIDIQVVIKGEEGFGWKSRAECTSSRGEMDTVKDILFFDDKPQTYVYIKSGEIAIFFPEDAHAPLVGEGIVKKAIVKVLA